MSRFRRANGVTLVELMVALAVFSTVMAGISVVFISSMRAWRTGRESRSVFEMARAAVQFMERDITSVFGSVDRDEFRTLVGTRDWLTFVGITENPVTGQYRTAHSDMARIMYVLEPNPAVPDEHLLLRLVQLDVDELGGSSRPGALIPPTVAAWNRIIEEGSPETEADVQLDDFELASNILDMEFRYGVVDPDAVWRPEMTREDWERTVVWRYDWDSRNRTGRRLPDVIEVGLLVRAAAKMPTDQTMRRGFRSTIFLPLGYRRPLPAVLQ